MVKTSVLPSQSPSPGPCCLSQSYLGEVLTVQTGDGCLLLSPPGLLRAKQGAHFDCRRLLELHGSGRVWGSLPHLEACSAQFLQPGLSLPQDENQ